MRFNHLFDNYTYSLASGRFQLKVSMTRPETRGKEKEGLEIVNKETKVTAISQRAKFFWKDYQKGKTIEVQNTEHARRTQGISGRRSNCAGPRGGCNNEDNVYAVLDLLKDKRKNKEARNKEITGRGWPKQTTGEQAVPRTSGDDCSRKS